MQSASRRTGENITHDVISKHPTFAPQYQLRKSPLTSFCREADHDLRPSAPSAKSRNAGIFATKPTRFQLRHKLDRSQRRTTDIGDQAPHISLSRVGARVPPSHLRARPVPVAAV